MPSASTSTAPTPVLTHLPLVHLVLAFLVLLDQIVQHPLQTVRVRADRRHRVLHRPLHQDAIDHPETLPLPGKRFERLEHESVGAVSA